MIREPAGTDPGGRLPIGPAVAPERQENPLILAPVRTVTREQPVHVQAGGPAGRAEDTVEQEDGPGHGETG